MYFPQEPAIRIHQIRVCPCPVGFPPGYYWYGRKQHSPGPPCWVEDLHEKCVPEAELTDGTEQPGLDEELDEEPNCDILDPDTWTSESEEDAERSTTLVVAPPPEMEGADRNEKTKYSLRRRVEPPKRPHN